ncbi:hypothetical protein RMSM_00944 [Rhodopirellula maiorica SM1]|uniref:DUF4340 domain-containing protein n=1 Tax=Rhodopirellula maiorica SM1 TaxID=1265738 RepID=M5S7F8_9BACT|nr:DUF4340 domain-containing protein [Rhodopirellula maiorica]EMI22119.1 hypothetical protein RMSM_00944 [Rhodopirellula maiorica SM1]
MSTITHNQSTPNGNGKLGDHAGDSIRTASESVSERWSKLGSETRRTVLYAVAGLACLTITAGVEWASRPAEIQEFGKVGEPFFPDFTDPTRATALNVAVIDKDQVTAQEFAVEQTKNGQWVIPSHHHYPADAEDKLAKTASSVIGITRGAMVSRWASDHPRYGVVDPKVDSLGVDQLEGIGKRLTLRGEGDDVLADYIIGDQVEGEDNQYYVRHPEEDETYVATLDIDLSTRFREWIDTDLLGVNSSDIVHLSLNDYQFDELNATVTQRDVTTLRRESSGDPWQMIEIDDAVAEVDADAVRETINAIAGLNIAGVRPKQKGLTPQLQLDRKSLGSQRDVDRLQSDLLSRGFLLQPASDSDPNTLKLIAREGELSTATNDGLVYKLHFGRVFTGSQEELEIGLTSDTRGEEEKQTEESEKTDVASDEQSEENGDGDEQQKDKDKPGRYVFVTVAFDKQYLGDEPSKPSEPERPDALQQKDSDESSDVNSSADAKAEEGEENDAKLEEVRKAYENQMDEYQLKQREFEAYQEKVETGKEKAENLNHRYAQWYYVIPGEEYDKLALSRSDFIKAKEQPEDDSAANEETGVVTETSSDPSVTEAAADPESEAAAASDDTDEGSSSQSSSEPRDDESTETK